MKNFLKTKNKPDKGSSFLIGMTDTFSDLKQQRGSMLFLGKYTLREVAAVLKKKGIVREAKKRGLWPIEIDIDSSEFPPLQRLRMYYQTKRPDRLIVDLKIRESRFKPAAIPSFSSTDAEYSFLVLEWLTLQNPLKKFSRIQTPLPGQTMPGLNLGRKVMDLFIDLAELNQNDGILAFPAYFHNAILFSRRFSFMNPDKTAEVSAIIKSFPGISFKHLAWAAHLNCIRFCNGKYYEWKAEEQIYPLHRSLKRYFSSSAYTDAVKEAEPKLKFFLDWELYRSRLNETGIHFADFPE